MEEMESVCFGIITHAGTARSLLMEAIREAREGNHSEAGKKLTEAGGHFARAHQVHARLIQTEVQGDHVSFSLLLIHAEDQLMSAKTIKHLARELVCIYKRLEN
ncbi:PTS lactose/cellobiose transporter subunit IIA [Thermoactinomyces sp. AMNI-1]|uniref:PTS lactose/cellobiose transporter subunit IIA n=2 Tax=Thermoactinomyces mirandus TaxID=2756294 RepID=A0A7W1XUA7_9BACL|nr:PTS lactose/cellobiose transporter subunit IIA [Thermoactinomyces mirandus]